MNESAWLPTVLVCGLAAVAVRVVLDATTSPSPAPAVVAMDVCHCQTPRHDLCGQHYFDYCRSGDLDCIECLLAAQLDCQDRGEFCGWSEDEIAECQKGVQERYAELCITP